MKRPKAPRGAPVEIETACCATCQIFTPTSDLVFGPRGTVHCLSCGVPKTPPAGDTDDDFVATFRAPPLDRAARLVAAAMLTSVVFSWLAAFASQL